MTEPTDQEKLVWVGLMDVVPLPGNDSLNDHVGAYVHVFAPAKSWEEFAEVARLFLESEGWKALSADDIKIATEDELSPELWALVNEVSETREPVLGDAFHSYPAVDEDD